MWSAPFGHWCHLKPDDLIELPVAAYLECIKFIEAQYPNS